MSHSKIRDFSYNIAASLMSVAILQLLVYPHIAKALSISAYGDVLTIMGIVNILIVVFGNTLNNIRLIENSLYVTKQLTGDFQIILVRALGLALCLGMLAGVYLGIGTAEIVLLIIVLLLGILKAYACVEYRIVINFKKILWLNLFTGLGYIFGLIVYNYLWQQWISIFLLGELFAIVYLYSSTNILQEKFTQTELFELTSKKYLDLLYISLMANILVYIDRFILYPLLGAEAVAIYFSASFLGKTLGLVTVPVAGVLLSYYAQSGYKITRKQFLNKVFITGGLCTMVLIPLNVVAPYIIRMLYPDLYDASHEYLALGNIAAILLVFSSVLNPVILKFVQLRIQLYMQLVYLLIYIVVAGVLASKFSIVGFCYAAICANTARVIIQIYIGYKYME